MTDQLSPAGPLSEGIAVSNQAGYFGSPYSSVPARIASGLSHRTCSRAMPSSLVWSQPWANCSYVRRARPPAPAVGWAMTLISISWVTPPPPEYWAK